MIGGVELGWCGKIMASYPAVHGSNACQVLSLLAKNVVHFFLSANMSRSAIGSFDPCFWSNPWWATAPHHADPRDGILQKLEHLTAKPFPGAL